MPLHSVSSPNLAFPSYTNDPIKTAVGTCWILIVPQKGCLLGRLDRQAERSQKRNVISSSMSLWLELVYQPPFTRSLIPDINFQISFAASILFRQTTSPIYSLNRLILKNVHSKGFTEYNSADWKANYCMNYIVEWVSQERALIV